MLQIQQIRADKESIIDRILKIRKLDVSSQVNEIFDLDVRKRETQKSLDDFSSKMNIISSQIGDCFKNGEIDKANSLKKETTDLKDQIKSLKSTFNAFDNLIKELLYQIPNLPNELVLPLIAPKINDSS